MEIKVTWMELYNVNTEKGMLHCYKDEVEADGVYDNGFWMKKERPADITKHRNIM